MYRAQSHYETFVASHSSTVVILLSSEQNDAVCDATKAEQELNDGFQAIKADVANPVKSLRTGLVHHETIDDIMSLVPLNI